MIYTLTTSTWAYFQQIDLTGAINCRTSADAHRIVPGKLDIRGEHDYGADPDFPDRPSYEVVWSWITLVLMPLLSTIGFAAIGVATSSAPSLRLSSFTTGRRLTLYFDQRASSLHRVAARGQIQSQEPYRHFGYRFGDQSGVVLSRLCAGFGLGLAAVSWMAVPIRRSGAH